MFLFDRLKQYLYSDHLKQTYRVSSSDFTRERKMPFDRVVLFMMNFVKRSLSFELSTFMGLFPFQSGDKITNSAFNQNRMKLKPEVFKDMLEFLNGEFYADNETRIKRWNGFRLLSNDCSFITLPSTAELRNKYGAFRNQNQTDIVQARGSFLYDVLNRIVITGKMAVHAQGEITLAIEQTSHISTGDLVLYDRGYPSFELMYGLTKKGAQFVMRCKHEWSNQTRAFMQDEALSKIISIKPGRTTPIKSKPYHRHATLQVRLLKVVLSSGEVELLITSLTDEQQYPNELLGQLYHLRWGIETFVDELKNLLQVEKFSGYKEQVIQQDFYCALLVSNLQSLLISEMEQEVSDTYGHRKYQYKVNTNLSYGFLKNKIIGIFLDQQPDQILASLRQLLLEHVVPIRPGRKFKREKDKYRTRKKPLFINTRKPTL